MDAFTGEQLRTAKEEQGAERARARLASGELAAKAGSKGRNTDMGRGGIGTTEVRETQETQPIAPTTVGERTGAPKRSDGDVGRPAVSGAPTETAGVEGGNASAGAVRIGAAMGLAEDAHWAKDWEEKDGGKTGSAQQDATRPSVPNASKQLVVGPREEHWVPGRRPASSHRRAESIENQRLVAAEELLKTMKESFCYFFEPWHMRFVQNFVDLAEKHGMLSTAKEKLEEALRAMFFPRLVPRLVHMHIRDATLSKIHSNVVYASERQPLKRLNRDMDAATNEYMAKYDRNRNLAARLDAAVEENRGNKKAVACDADYEAHPLKLEVFNRHGVEARIITEFEERFLLPIMWCTRNLYSFEAQDEHYSYASWVIEKFAQHATSESGGIGLLDESRRMMQVLSETLLRLVRGGHDTWTGLMRRVAKRLLDASTARLVHTALRLQDEAASRKLLMKVTPQLFDEDSCKRLGPNVLVKVRRMVNTLDTRRIKMTFLLRRELYRAGRITHAAFMSGDVNEDVEGNGGSVSIS